jgi:hypothetical protein
MSDKLILNANIGISNAPEAALSQIKRLAADYAGAVTNALNIQIPGAEKILNEGLIGRGDEFATQADVDYAMQTGMTFSDRLNTSQFAVLAARTLSGTITTTSLMTGVYQHEIQMQASSADPQLKSSSIAFELGGLDFILGGMVGSQISVSVQGGAAPTYQVPTVGTGYWEYMDTQTPALVLPDAPDQDYVGQKSQTAVRFNDGTIFDLGSLGRVDHFNLDFNNNLVVGEKRIGDPIIDSTDQNSAAYVRQLTRGNRTLGVSMGVYVSTDKRGFLAHIANTEITGLYYNSQGKFIATDGTDDYYHSVAFTVPRSVITTPSLGGDRKGIITLNFAPLFNSTDGNAGPFKITIVNDQATLV